MGKRDDPHTQRRMQAVRWYRHALERGDFAVVTTVLGKAEDDPILEAMLLKVDRLSQAQDGIAVHADQLFQAHRFLRVLREAVHSGAKDESLDSSKYPLMTTTGKNGTMQEERLQQSMQTEISLMPPNPGARRKAAPRMIRFPRAVGFIQTAAAVLIVGVLITGFLLVFFLRSGVPRQTAHIDAQPSSPPGIYISRADGVYRYDVQTHKVIWRTHVADQSRFPGNPVVIGDTVYITMSGFIGPSLVSALDAQTGALRWSRDFPYRVRGPSLDNGQLYFPANGVNPLYAVNPTTGSITATYTPRYGKSWYAPVVVDGVLYYTDDSSGSILYAVQLPGEKLLWQQQLSTSPLNLAAGGGIVVQNGKVYIPVTPETVSQNGWIDAFDAHTGQKRWQSPAITIADGGSTLLITNTMIYVATLLGDYGKLLAFDVHTHALVWQQPYETFAMQVASGMLYIEYGTVSHAVYPPEFEGLAALNASTGKLLWKTPINRAGGDDLTGVVNGVFYGIAWSTFDGKAFTGTIYALNARNGTQIWAMPTSATVLQWGGMVVA